MTETKKISRRRLLGQAAGVALAGITLPACHTSSSDPAPEDVERTPEAGTENVSPNEQIGVGIIGCGRRNGQLVIGRGGQGKPPKEAQIVAVADLNIKRAEQWADKYQCPAHQDYRELLDRKEVDVVIYATPEHWHYLPCIRAAQAGKDMYGEQPLSHTIREGRVMTNAVRKHKRIFQTGEQQRSHPKTREAVELILNGRIGKIKSVIGYNYPSPWECGFPGQPVPEELDWDRWCGPNEVVPFHQDLYLSRVPYERELDPPGSIAETAVGPGWMSFRPYSGGELVNWGCHGLSMVQWALQMDDSGPVEVWVEPDGQKLETLVYEKPESRERGDAFTSKTIINYRFANDVVLSLSSSEKRLGGGAKFIGEEGEITIWRDNYECNPKELSGEPLPGDAIRVYKSDNHMENFFECVKTRKDPIMDVEKGHRVATLCHLGNIARWLGRSVKWDPEKEEFPGDEAANQLLDTPKREGFELPAEV
jgi:predicted dehydrogenase